jgi:hypothetical protein
VPFAEIIRLFNNFIGTPVYTSGDNRRQAGASGKSDEAAALGVENRIDAVEEFFWVEPDRLAVIRDDVVGIVCELVGTFPPLLKATASFGSSQIASL